MDYPPIVREFLEHRKRITVISGRGARRFIGVLSSYLQEDVLYRRGFCNNVHWSYLEEECQHIVRETADNHTLVALTQRMDVITEMARAAPPDDFMYIRVELSGNLVTFTAEQIEIAWCQYIEVR